MTTMYVGIYKMGSIFINFYELYGPLTKVNDFKLFYTPQLD